MDKWKSRGEKSQRGEGPKREDQRREGVRRKKMQVREKLGKLRNTLFLQWLVAPGRKVGSLKRWVRSHVVRWEIKSCTPLWREAHSQVKMHKAHQRRTTFGSVDVEKVHAVVARSTFRSQNAQNTSTSDHIWKCWCRKSAGRCGVKHISKSKVWKTDGFGALLEVEMSEKCTPLWRKAHYKVKMYKTRQPPSTFGSWDVEKVYAVVARSTFRSQNVQSTTCSRHFWRFRCRFAWQAHGILHLAKSEQNVKVCSISKTMAGEVSALISWEKLHFGASDLQFWEDNFAWQVQHFVWPGITFSWQVQYIRQMEWKNHKKAMVRSRQLCIQLSIFDWSLAQLLRRIASFSSLQIAARQIDR